MPRRRGLRPRLLAAVIRSNATLAFAAERQVVGRTSVVTTMEQLAGLVLILGIAAPGCFRTISLEGAVADTAGAPVSAARITVMGHAYATDARGCFSLRERMSFLGPGYPGVKIESEGYKMNVFGFPAGTKMVSMTLASSSSPQRTTARVVADLPTCR